MVQKGQTIFFKTILAAIFVTIAKVNTRLLHFGYSSNNQTEEIGEKHLRVLGFRGAK